MSHPLPNPSELETLGSGMNARLDQLSDRYDRMLIAQIGGYLALAIAIFLN
jgi:hypothetical protein